MKAMLAIFAAALVAIAATAVPQHAEEPRPLGAEQNFLGKSYMVTAKETPATWFMTDVNIVDISDRRFLVGKGFGSKDRDYRVDKQVGVPWEQVASFVEMSEDDYKVYLQMYFENQAKKQQLPQ